MRLDLDGRITRTSARLETLAADPQIVAVGPQALKRLVDAFRDDHLYNNLLILDAATGDVRLSAVPYDGTWNGKDASSFQRALQSLDFAVGRFIPEPASHASGLNVAQPLIDQSGQVKGVLLASLRMDWAEGFIAGSGLPAGTILNVFDSQGVMQYRSAEAEKYVGK